jgi:hypothetical protein
MKIGVVMSQGKISFLFDEIFMENLWFLINFSQQCQEAKN